MTSRPGFLILTYRLFIYRRFTYRRLTYRLFTLRCAQGKLYRLLSYRLNLRASPFTIDAAKLRYFRELPWTCCSHSGTS
jgi:hypothetical protein